MSQNPRLQQVTRQLIAQELDASHTPDELAVAAVSMFTRLLSALSAVLGQTGSTALFRRSLKLAEATVPFYAQVRTAEHDKLFDALSASLRQQRPEVVREASQTLLTTYIELLATFIGEQLTWQLLQEAWPAVRSSRPQENEQ
jgi:hypothetical protein